MNFLTLKQNSTIMIDTFRLNLITLFSVIFLCTGIVQSHAEKITDISIQYMGAESVDRSAIMAQIRSKAGSELDAQIVEEDIKTYIQVGLLKV